MRTLFKLMVPFASLAAGVAVVSLHGGCGSSSPPTPNAVRGRVTFQGQPVGGGLVVFTPDPDRGSTGKPARGETGPDGTFQLRHGDGTAIPPGWYRVSIAADASPGLPPFPAKLARPDLSKLIREVAAGKENVFEFAVEVPVN